MLKLGMVILRVLFGFVVVVVEGLGCSGFFVLPHEKRKHLFLLFKKTFILELSHNMILRVIHFSLV